MTDRIKGYLVTLEGDIREDDAEAIQNALQMIKGVFSVEPYIKGAEDYMMETRARIETLIELSKTLQQMNGIIKRS